MKKQKDKPYLNEEYWLRLHLNLKGRLQAVGWPELSEQFNQIKYQSELNSFLEILNQFSIPDNYTNDITLKIFDVGVGTGFWTSAVQDFYAECGLTIELTVADISHAALDFVVACHPNLTAEHVDLSCVPVDKFAQKFDMVLSIMVLLHLTNVEAFHNGLRFCANSVREGGILVLYEPIITAKYSPWRHHPKSLQGNSCARCLSEYEHILTEEKFDRFAMLSGASWLTNSPIESDTYIGFKLKYFFWKVLSKAIYSSDWLSNLFRLFILRIDRLIKRKGDGCSGKFLIYKKRQCSSL